MTTTLTPAAAETLRLVGFTKRPVGWIRKVHGKQVTQHGRTTNLYITVTYAPGETLEVIRSCEADTIVDAAMELAMVGELEQATGTFYVASNRY